MKENTENRVTKCCKIRINKIESPTDSWREFEKIFETIQKETVIASNKVIAVCNGYSALGEENKKEWLTLKYGTENIRNALYWEARKVCNFQYSKAANTISNNIYKNYFTGKNSWKTRAEKGEGNPPMSFSSSIPINISNDHTKIEVIDQGRRYYKFSMSFLNTEASKGISYIEREYKDGKWSNKKKIIEISNRKIVFYLTAKPGSQAADILAKLANPNTSFKLGDSTISRQREKKRRSTKPGEGKYSYWFNMSYSCLPSEIDPFDKSRVIGVDVGVNIPMACSANFDENIFWKIGNRNIFDQARRDEKWQSKKKQAIKYNGRDGHGRKYKLDQSNNKNIRIDNRQKTFNQQCASELIKLCKKEKAGTIHIEDLSGLSEASKDNLFLKSWPYYGMQQAIVQAAEKEGIDVLYINRYQTSQECPKCHHIDKENRPKAKMGQQYFKCVNCGYEDNADHVAAINIAHRNPDKCKKNKTKIGE